MRTPPGSTLIAHDHPCAHVVCSLARQNGSPTAVCKATPQRSRSVGCPVTRAGLLDAGARQQGTSGGWGGERATAWPFTVHAVHVCGPPTGRIGIMWPASTPFHAKIQSIGNYYRITAVTSELADEQCHEWIMFVVVQPGGRMPPIWRHVWHTCRQLADSGRGASKDGNEHEVLAAGQRVATIIRLLLQPAGVHDRGP